MATFFFICFVLLIEKIEILTNFKLFTPQCIETISNNRSSRTIDYIIINVKIKIKIEIEKKISCVCDSRSFNDLDWIIIMMMMILSIFISYLWLYNGNLFFFLPTRTNHNDDGPKFFFFISNHSGIIKLIKRIESNEMKTKKFCKILNL